MTDEIPRAAYEYANKLRDISPSKTYCDALARLAHENGLVPKDVDVLATLLGDIGITPYPAAQVHADNIRTELVKHGYAVVKVATDEERLIEARELCAKVAEEFGEPGWALAYRAGDYDTDAEMIAMLAALKAREK